MTARRYRKKPVVIEAIQWIGENVEEVMAFAFADTRWQEALDSAEVNGPGIGHTPAIGTLDIPTLEGVMTAQPGDWIVRGVQGELYPCKPDVFAATYEPVAAEHGEIRALPSGPVLWFGGKGHLSKWIVEHLPEHSTYVEPYGGAASVLFAKPPAPIEVYNDLHGDLVNLMRVLRSDAAERLQAEASLILHSRAEFEAAVDLLNSDEDDPYLRALAFFVGMNQGFGGTYPTLGRWAKSKGQRLSGGMGNNTAQWWRKVGFISDWHERLATVQIENRPAIDVMRDFDSLTTTHYVDPPYPTDTRRKSLNAYKHEATTADHRDLVKCLLDLDGAVVLSGYDTDIYEPLAEAGWKKVTRSVHARGAGAGGDKGRTEVLWLNREPAFFGNSGGEG